MDTDAISEGEWAEWKRKRRHTLIGYLIVGVMVGIDYSFMFTTLYLYLEQMIKTPNPRFVSKVRYFQIENGGRVHGGFPQKIFHREKRHS